MIVKGSGSHRTIYFMGNSHMNYGNGNIANVGEMPTVAYAAIRALNYNYSMQNYSVGGKQTNQMIAEFAAVLLPYLKVGDVVFFFELVNDMGAGGGNQTNAQAYANAIAYCNLCRSRGAKVVIASTIPNGVNGGNEVNYAVVDGNIRTNWTTFADGYCDFRTLPNYQSVADASNTLYFNADTNHQITLGNTTLGNFAATKITPLLTL